MGNSATAGEIPAVACNEEFNNHLPNRLYFYNLIAAKTPKCKIGTH